MRIGDYVIHFPLIAAIIIIPVFIALIVIFIINKKQDKRNLELNLITKYQKNKLVEILEEEINSSPNALEWYHPMLRNLQGYIRRKRYWDPQEIMDEIHEEALIYLTIIVFDRIRLDVEVNKKNEAVLLCHALDFINCGLEYTGNIVEWIGDEIECQKNHKDMSDNEGRLFSILSSTLEKLWDLIDEDLEKIPEEVEGIDPILKTYKDYDFEEAYSDVHSCVDFRNLKPETFDILARGLVFTIDELLDVLDKKYLPYYQVYYVRALASCLDRQLYDKILTSIEYK